MGKLEGVAPAPLILDTRVWRALRELGWDSLVAANGDRRWGMRYLAYLCACDAWAEESDSSPEDIEYSLFCRGGMPLS